MFLAETSHLVSELILKFPFLLLIALRAFHGGFGMHDFRRRPHLRQYANPVHPANAGCRVRVGALSRYRAPTASVGSLDGRPQAPQSTGSGSVL